MYKPSFMCDRTEEEKRDIFKSWMRDDQPFFASGACHILAEVFTQLHQHENFKMIHIKPTEGFTGNHVYASDGKWAFDHNGWTEESTLLEVTEAAFKEKYPEWGYERIVIEPTITSLEDFCKKNKHRLPWQYAHLPWERAYGYITKFDSMPPKS